jgi:hypothetical protein
METRRQFQLILARRDASSGGRKCGARRSVPEIDREFVVRRPDIKACRICTPRRPAVRCCPPLRVGDTANQIGALIREKLWFLAFVLARRVLILPVVR